MTQDEIWNATEDIVPGSNFLCLEADQNFGSGFDLQRFFFPSLFPTACLLGPSKGDKDKADGESGGG